MMKIKNKFKILIIKLNNKHNYTMILVKNVQNKLTSKINSIIELIIKSKNEIPKL